MSIKAAIAGGTGLVSAFAFAAFAPDQMPAAREITQAVITGIASIPMALGGAAVAGFGAAVAGVGGGQGMEGLIPVIGTAVAGAVAGAAITVGASSYVAHQHYSDGIQGNETTNQIQVDPEMCLNGKAVFIDLETSQAFTVDCP